MKCLICPRNLTSTINVTFNFPSLQAKPTWQQEKGLSSPHLQVSNINWKPTQLLSLKTSLPDSLNIKETEKALGSQKAFEERETHSTFKQTSLKSILHIQSLKEMQLTQIVMNLDKLISLLTDNIHATLIDTDSTNTAFFTSSSFRNGADKHRIKKQFSFKHLLRELNSGRQILPC